ncbi:MAG: hypothetical protein JW924_11970 [Fusobacteriaceae bacterium]|nr:hypothetical protein [Fusobacteriaceae bacterium]
MSRTHELMLRINSALDGNFGSNIQRIIGGTNNVTQRLRQLNSEQAKVKAIELNIRGYDKTQAQLEVLRNKKSALITQAENYRQALANTEQGSEAYVEITRKLELLEREQNRVETSTHRLTVSSETYSTQLRAQGVDTNNMSSERQRLTRQSENLREETEQLTRSQNRNQRASEEQSNKLGKLSGAMKGLVLAGAGLLSLSAMKQYGDEAISIAKEKIKAETDLQAMLTNTKKLYGDKTAIKNATKDLINYANEIEAVGVIGDETVIAGQAQLATFQLMPATIKKLSNGMVDMLAKNKGANATTEDATNIGNLFGKVMTGNVGALSKYGVTMTEAQKKTLKMGTETQKAALLAKILEENYGGANKALGETDEGKIVRYKNEIEGIKEEFGKGLLPIQRQFFEIFRNQGPNISKVLTLGLNISTKFFTLFQKMNPDKVFNLLYKSADLAFQIVGKVVDKGLQFTNWVTATSGRLDAFKSIMVGLAVGIGTYSAALKISSFWTKLTSAETGALTIKQLALNLAMKMNPIGLIVAGLMALGAGVIYAYKHSETFRNAVDKLWERIKKLIEPLKTAAGWVAKLFDGGDKKLTITTKFDKPPTGGNPQGNIPKFAVGGVVDRPTYALVGEGKEKETIIPHNRSKRSIALLEYTAKAMGMGKNQNKIFSSSSGEINNLKVSSGGKQIIVQKIEIIIQGTGEVLKDTAKKAKELANNFKKELENLDIDEMRTRIG